MAFGQRKLSATGKRTKKKGSAGGGKDSEASSSNDNEFKSFNLSKKTLNGLTYAGYKVPTEIQSATIGPALEGADILGAAKTGSGKTLAFLIPLLEKLESENWTHMDGMGALIITPTRELAYQIFETINKIGLYHDFSVGLIIGGKDLKFERHRMNKCNIVICTPGRLLQHMNENPLFNCDNTRILVLDEADRILDMGFKKTMDAIIEYLPKERQTLLFSATQTKSVKDLARLSLVDPKYIAVHEQSNSVTPEGLVEKYVVCEAHQKLNALWSFIKQNLTKKILVFVSTCKQVKFIFELFCRMKPGTSMMALYGSLHQLRRMNIYNDFKSAKKACLIATDIASRGLDFPAVNWVVQLDCPEDTNQYIHRAGRTARYHKGGESLLFLTPSEEKSMVEQLVARKVPIKKSSIAPHGSIIRKAEALLARDVALKETAQRAFKSYIKDVYMMKDKTIFDVTSIDKDMLSRSFGLIVTPRVRFLENKGLNKSKPTSSVPSNPEDNNNPVEIKSNKMVTLTGYASDESDGEDLFISKKVANIPDIDINAESLVRTSKGKFVTQAALAKKILRKNLTVNKKIVFDKEGKPIEEFPLEQKSEKVKLLDEKCKSGIDIEIAKEIMQDEDKVDKELHRKLIKEKHRAKRLKEREEKKLKAEEAKKRFAERRGLSKSDSKSRDEEDEEASVQDENGSDDSEREDQLDDYIDQLPDPDLYYGKDGDDEDDEDDDEDEGEDDEDDEDDDDKMRGDQESDENTEDEEDVDSDHEKPRKRIKTKDTDDEDEDEDLPLTLHDAETIAKQFIDN